MPELDFEQARQDLLADIDVPELGTVRNRARTIRRRRRAIAAAGSALAVVFALGTGGLLIGRDTGDQVDVAASATASLPGGVAWQGGGLTLLGLSGAVVDLPGELRDIQFADSQRGYALAAQCSTLKCRIAVAATADGGHTWNQWALPIVDTQASGVPTLITVDDGVVLRAGAEAWFSPPGKAIWSTVDTAAQPALDQIPEGGRIAVAKPAGRDGCAAGPVQVWSPDGTLGRLRKPPAMQVCWVSPVRAADGRWWVGGTVTGTGQPAMAYSRDAGASWSVSPVDGPNGAWVQVTTVGGDTYAAVVSVRSGTSYPDMLTIHSVLRSLNGGALTPYAGQVGTVVGDVVPLLDRRLVVASPEWYVGTPTLQPAGGTMPWVYRLQRTPGAWVAYDLLKGGWAAVSTDGQTWQKINVR